MEQHTVPLDAPMPQYRLYFLDSHGHIRSAKTIEAADDEGAVLMASEGGAPGARELWQRARRVAILNAGPQAA